MWWNGEAKELSVVFSQIRPISHQKIYSWLETIHPSLLTHLSRLSEPREIPSWPVNKGFLGTSSRPLLYGFFGQRSLIYSTMFHLSARACAGRSGSKVGDKASLWPSFPAPPPFFRSLTARAAARLPVMRPLSHALSRVHVRFCALGVYLK